KAAMGLQKILRFILKKRAWSERMAFAAMLSQAALDRILARGMSINTVIDIGASNGMWSETVMPYFPKAKFLLIEAQEVHLAALQQFSARHPNAEFVLKAAGEEAGTIYFDGDEPFS